MAAAVDVGIPVAGPAPFQVFPDVSDSNPKQILSRKRRMNFYDLANLLDSDGNLQNEMLVFAFAATMLSTIPVLLGNEFDVNVGLRRRKRDLPPEPENPWDSSYVSYAAADEDDDNYSPAFFSTDTYKKIMTSKNMAKDASLHVHGGEASSLPREPQTYPYKESAEANQDMSALLRELLQWSQEKITNKPLMPMLINLALDKYQGRKNPADKLVKTAYKKWKNLY